MAGSYVGLGTNDIIRSRDESVADVDGAAPSIRSLLHIIPCRGELAGSPPPRDTGPLFPEISRMPIALSLGYPSLLLRRSAFEKAGLTRTLLDERLGLGPDEFTVEGDLICIGPVHDDEAFQGLLVELESLGLVSFDDFFDLGGNWPPWLALYAMSVRPST